MSKNVNGATSKQVVSLVARGAPFGNSPLDLILGGAAPPSPSPQPALAIKSTESKKRIKRALCELLPDVAKLITHVSTLDGGKPTSRHVVYTMPQHVPEVRHLITHLEAFGIQVEDATSGVSPVDTDGFTQVIRKRKKSGPLALKSAAGLSDAIARAGKQPRNPKRVKGQCDYYTAKLQCHRGSDCKFACYNGPASN